MSTWAPLGRRSDRAKSERPKDTAWAFTRVSGPPVSGLSAGQYCVISRGHSLPLRGLTLECRFDVAFHQWTSQGQTSRHSRILFPPAIYFAFMLSSAFYEEKLLNMIQRRGSLEHQQHCCPLRIRKTRLNPQPPVGFLFPKNVVDVSL